MIDREMGLAVVWMFGIAAWFIVVGYITASGDYVTAILMTVIGVFAAFSQLQVYYDDRVRVRQLRHRLNRIIPVRGYEMRRERGIRVLVAYLRGERR
ncbi:hypothetical protein [Natronorubrum sp. A-ect3]|uniref:hypothetical protein n=1 Tax=Natronorubrum sp. A-ect3 TaxID=3242698 RepID=UPI00359CEE10